MLQKLNWYELRPGCEHGTRRRRSAPSWVWHLRISWQGNLISFVFFYFSLESNKELLHNRSWILVSPSTSTLRSKGLAVLDLPRAVLLETDTLDGNEAGGVLRSPVHVEGVHAALIGGVEVGGLGGTSDDVGVTLVGDQANLTLNLALRELDGVLNELTLRAEVHAVVDGGRPVLSKTVTDGSNLGVEDKTLKVDVSLSKDGKTGGVVASSALQADESRLDNVNTSDAVGSADLVGLLEDLQGSSDGLVANLELDGNTLLEVDGEGSRLIGSLHGVYRQSQCLLISTMLSSNLPTVRFHMSLGGSSSVCSRI